MRQPSISLLSAALAAAFFSASAQAAETLDITKVGSTYFHSTSGTTGPSSFAAEIAAYDAATSTLWVTGINGVDVLNVTSSGLTFNSRIDVSPFGSINSVAISNGVAAFAIENTVDRELPGIVQFYDTGTRSLLGGVNNVQVGSLPDMLTFTADGSKLLVANEATPTQYRVGEDSSPTANDPVGGVSIINMSDRSVTTLDLVGANFAGGVINASGDGLRPNATFNYEPEYIAVNNAGTRAYITLQEHNALATLNLETNQFEGIVGLGLKDYSDATNGNATPISNAIDPTNTSPISLVNVNLKGAYQPDAVATYEVNGQTFLVMANEGDAQENDGDVDRAGTLYGSAAPLNRINVIKDLSSADNLVSMGGRSFSIRDTAGNIVYDSGNILDAQAIALGIYDDGRSDDKGVEPEGVTLRTINGRTYAFVGLERTSKGAVAVFDITDPLNASFVEMVVTDGTNRPEGLTTFVQDDTIYLAISNEGLGGATAVGMSTVLYSITPVPEPETWAMLLSGLGLMGMYARRRKAKGEMA